MTAFKLILVDDEPVSADSLGDLLKAEIPSLHIRVAYCAMHALSMAREEKCDLLITDIQMPGMTGLELAKEVKNLSPDTQIMFLTGFDDFAYAYEAFSQRAAHYLLKTEGDTRILAAVREMVALLEKQRRVSDGIQKAERLYEKMLPFYTKQILTQLVLDPQALSREQLSDIGILNGDVYMIVARGVDRHAAKERLIALMAGEDIFKDAFAGENGWTESFFAESDFIWLIAAKQGDSFVNALFQVARLVRKHMEERFGLKLFFVVAEKAVSTNRLCTVYEKIRGMLSLKILRGETGAAILNDENAEQAPILAPETVMKLNQLRSQVDACQRDIRDGHMERLNKDMEPVLMYLDAPDPGTAEYSMEFAATLAGALLCYVHRNNLSADSLEWLGGQSGLPDHKSVRQLLCLVQSQNEQRVNVALRSVTRYVLSYIHEHLAENIGVAEMSNATGYSAGYLSRVFKQQEGITIHEYLTMARMNLARELLLNTTLRIYEIAESCGYDNTTYFIKVFRQNTGMTPQEYKQVNSHRLRQ